MATNPAPDMLATHWRRLRDDDHEGIKDVGVAFGCLFPPRSEGYEEDENFIYLPVSVLLRDGDEIVQQSVMFAVGDGILVTVEPAGGFPPFDRAGVILKRRADTPRDAYGIMYALLLATNAASDHIVEIASAALEAMADRIPAITMGADDDGREMSTDDINRTMAELNEHEELISRIQEAQLLLERAARHLRSEINGESPALRQQLDTLISDIQSVKEHAGFEHDKVRYLQQSVMTSLNAKQNQVVKVFTIITAVFLPPTLIATFYGMNFAVMPELSWKWGFTATILLTLASALLPLLYIKRKGWLR